MEVNHKVIGIDIGGTKILAALFHPNGNIIQKEAKLVAGRKGKEVINLIGTMAQSLIDYARKQGYQVVAMGVGVPGIYNPVKKTAWAPNLTGWDHIALWEELSGFINDSSIELFIDSDRSCYILGEVWKGCAKGCTDAIFVSVGTGIGAGILAGGRIVTGQSGIAGAIGWLALEPGYQAKYDAWGNFEHFASGNGIARSAQEILIQERATRSLLDAKSRSEITSSDVFNAFEQQDPVAVAVIEKAIAYWGMTVANLVSIFNPQKIILGGGVFGPAIPLIDTIFTEAKKWAQPLSFQQVSLEPSTLQGDAGLYGAGYLAIYAINKLDHGG